MYSEIVKILEEEPSLNLTNDKRHIFTDCISDCIHFKENDICEYNETCLRLAIDYFKIK